MAAGNCAEKHDAFLGSNTDATETSLPKDYVCKYTFGNPYFDGAYYNKDKKTYGGYSITFTSNE